MRSRSQQLRAAQALEPAAALPGTRRDVAVGLKPAASRSAQQQEPATGSSEPSRRVSPTKLGLARQHVKLVERQGAAQAGRLTMLSSPNLFVAASVLSYKTPPSRGSSCGSRA